MGIEIDFDPDGDVTKVGDYSLNFHYQTRALLTGCTNSGAVTGRNDYAGGIVGQAYIGQLTDCQSYGAVSTDGNYVGGIAGRSDSSIRLSWAKCTLSGEDYVGGIAGYGKTLSDCRSLVTVDGGAYTGAIAGDVDEDGSRDQLPVHPRNAGCPLTVSATPGRQSRRLRRSLRRRHCSQDLLPDGTDLPGGRQGGSGSPLPVRTGDRQSAGDPGEKGFLRCLA